MAHGGRDYSIAHDEARVAPLEQDAALANVHNRATAQEAARSGLRGWCWSAVKLSVTDRLVALSLSDDGHIRRYPIFDAAARAGLMMDLALAGHLVNADQQVELIAGVEREAQVALFDGMEANPGKDLLWWLAKGQTSLADAARDAERHGSIRRVKRTWRSPLKARYVVADTVQLLRDRAHAETGSPSMVDADVASRAVVAVAILAGMVKTYRTLPEKSTSGYGELDWLCQVAAEGLLALKRQYKAASAAL